MNFFVLKYKVKHKFLFSKEGSIYVYKLLYYSAKSLARYSLQKLYNYGKILHRNNEREICMPKFFINSNQIEENNKIVIIGEDVKHISNVLRMKPEDQVQVCNTETSINYLISLEKFEKDKIYGTILKEIKSEAESNVNINVFQGIPKSDKMELIIQKSTELGVKEFTPVDMIRCVSKVSQKDEKKKLERWQKISEVAAKQSGRDIIPVINRINTIEDICKKINEYDMIIVPYEKAENVNFKEAIEKIKSENKIKPSIGIVIGPEGGFEKSEIEKLKSSGAMIITLGKRILRTETVALAMVSVIMYELGGSI